MLKRVFRSVPTLNEILWWVENNFEAILIGTCIFLIIGATVVFTYTTFFYAEPEISVDDSPFDIYIYQVFPDEEEK